MISKIENVKIEDVDIILDERGILSIYIGFKYKDGGFQSLPSYAMQLPKDFKHYTKEGPLGFFIYELLELFNVKTFYALKNKKAKIKLVEQNNNWYISEISNVDGEKWFNPKNT